MKVTADDSDDLLQVDIDMGAGDRSATGKFTLRSFSCKAFLPAQSA
jgi:hypothetical protein